jgi:hypothetical protein
MRVLTLDSGIRQMNRAQKVVTIAVLSLAIAVLANADPKEVAKIMKHLRLQAKAAEAAANPDKEGCGKAIEIAATKNWHACLGVSPMGELSWFAHTWGETETGNRRALLVFYNNSRLVRGLAGIAVADETFPGKPQRIRVDENEAVDGGLEYNVRNRKKAQHLLSELLAGGFLKVEYYRWPEGSTPIYVDASLSGFAEVWKSLVAECHKESSAIE